MSQSLKEKVRKQRLKEYRAAITEVWFPIVGRSRLKAAEYELIEKWHNEAIPIYTVLTAIRDCASRGVTLYSIGVIKSDLARLRRRRQHSQIGAHSEEPEGDQWRAKWKSDLEDLISLASDCEEAAWYQSLINDLSSLTKEEAQMRFNEISKRV